MLTRLRVKGFKSLDDVTVDFGPFTCIAGANGAGKSNLFDAIVFLCDLADMPIIAAANRVRDRDGKRFGSVGAIFTRYRDGSADALEIEAEFLAPGAVVDDFGRHGAPNVTLLRYRIALGYTLDEKSGSERIQLLDEVLEYVPKRDFRRNLFPHGDNFWESVKGGTKTSNFISTEKSPAGPTPSDGRASDGSIRETCLATGPSPVPATPAQARRGARCLAARPSQTRPIAPESDWPARSEP